MGTYDLFRIISKSDLTTKERAVEQIQYDILADFYDSPSYQSVTINTTPRDVQITDENALTKNPNKKRILCKPAEDINIGDDILWNSQHWLCTNIDSDKEIYAKGIIEKCDNTLTFYKNSVSSTPVEVPYVIYGNNTSDMGTDENKFIIIPNSKMLILVANTNITRHIERNDIYKLYNVDGIVDNYKITDINRVKKSGLILLELEWCAEQQEQYIFTLEILNNSPTDLQESTALQLNVNIYNNGTLVSPLPAITYSSSNPAICTVNSLGLVTGIATGSCTISAKLTSNLTVLNSITINVVALPQNNYTYTLTSTSIPDTEIKVNQTKAYTATKFNNGLSVSQTFTFSVVGEASAYQLVIVDGNNCTVKALKSGYTIVLKATDNSDVTKIVEKSIILRNIF